MQNIFRLSYHKTLINKFKLAKLINIYSLAIYDLSDQFKLI